MIISVGFTVLHLIGCYLFCFTFGLGVYGPAVSQTLCNIIFFVLITVYSQRITDQNLKLAWQSPTKKSFNLRGLHEFMKIGWPSIIMTCLEWWSFELMTIIASYISI